ncbi:MAG: hypothetical protein LDL25_08370 [Hyphomicrobiales bacterium]|nr:hypothetical protein [Hyphomicrobiales bacterium]
MVFIRKPSPLPSALDYVPPNSVPYKVRNSDSWWTLAETENARQAKLAARDLCQFNFLTSRPVEVNWYLREKVGCRRTTHDGKNYMFSGADQPGIIYLPKIGLPPSPTAPGPDLEVRANSWIGIGIKGGGHALIWGTDTLLGTVWSMDTTFRNFDLMGETTRWGPGLGAGTNVAIIYMTGVKEPQDISGLKTEGWDINFSVGERLGDLTKAGKLAKLKPVIEPIIKLGAKSPEALKALIKAHPDKWVEAFKQSKTALEAAGVNLNGPPNVVVVDVPLAGVGLEVSGFVTVTKFRLW